MLTPLAHITTTRCNPTAQYPHCSDWGHRHARRKPAWPPSPQRGISAGHDTPFLVRNHSHSPARLAFDHDSPSATNHRPVPILLRHRRSLTILDPPNASSIPHAPFRSASECSSKRYSSLPLEKDGHASEQCDWQLRCNRQCPCQRTRSSPLQARLFHRLHNKARIHLATLPVLSTTHSDIYRFLLALELAGSFAQQAPGPC